MVPFPWWTNGGSSWWYTIFIFCCGIAAAIRWVLPFFGARTPVVLTAESGVQAQLSFRDGSSQTETASVSSTSTPVRAAVLPGRRKQLQPS